MASSMKSDELPVTVNDSLKRQEQPKGSAAMTKRGVYAAASYMASAGNFWRFFFSFFFLFFLLSQCLKFYFRDRFIKLRVKMESLLCYVFCGLHLEM